MGGVETLSPHRFTQFWVNRSATRPRVGRGLHRRHLSATQAAMVGARAREAREMYDRQAKERQKASGGDRKSAKPKSVPANLPELAARPCRGSAQQFHH